MDSAEERAVQAETVTRERDEQITSITAELEAIKLRERERAVS